MAGNSEGARKARETNLKNNPNYYADMGSRSWNDPTRSRKVGFAAHPELAAAAGALGGKKTKNDYIKKISDKTENTNKALRIQEENYAQDLANWHLEAKIFKIKNPNPPETKG